MMTWYTYHNYGTALQASALYHTITKLGYSVDMINYLPRPAGAAKTVSTLKSEIIEKAKEYLQKNYSSENRRKLFLKYLGDRITETEPCRSYVELNDLCDKYDAFVCGSDQIWSPLNFDDKYFLSFVDDTEKKIAYAPSMGTSSIKNPTIRSRIAKQIQTFKYLSVRETQGAQIISEITDKSPCVVLDPSLLITPIEWDEYASVALSNKLPTNDYIICYFLGNPNKYMGYVHRISKKMNIPYYIIPVKTSEKNSINCVPFEVGPSEFVSLIKNAKHVCTDSFHGVAFATNYNVPFSVFKRFHDNDKRNQNSRIFSFLNLISLESRLIDPKEKQITHMLDCDFSRSNEILKNMRQSSLNFLNSSLISATGEHPKHQSYKYKSTDRCCGGGVCSTVCSKNAISISTNDEGFQHYTIDSDKCVECGICKTVCPMTRVSAPTLCTSKGLYSAKSASSDVLKKSSSGGVAHELSKIFNKDNAYVCGCVYDSTNNSAQHIIISPNEPENLALLQGSKYIQSCSQKALTEIKSITKENKLIFFGTPCQCAAVDKLCQKYHTRENVYIVDLICHGVPSAYLFNKYLNDLNDKYKTGKAPTVLFRSNEGKKNERTIVVSGNGVTHRETEKKDDFYAFFRRGLCDMRSCYDCPYRQKSAADLRIGDYWGTRFKNDSDGVSMIIAVTDKGNELVSMLKNNNSCSINQYPLDEYWSIQAPYNHSPSLFREKIISEFKENHRSLSDMRKEYCSYYDAREKLSDIYQNIKHIIKR